MVYKQRRGIASAELSIPYFDPRDRQMSLAKNPLSYTLSLNGL